jgi:hypothetical protein
MTTRSVLSIHALLAIGFAIPLLAMPAAFLSLYGTQPDATAVYMARLLGAAFVTFAAIAWLARDAKEGPATDALCGGFAAGMLAGMLVSLMHQLTDPTINALGWSTVAVYAGLFTAYAALWVGRADRRSQAPLSAR